MTPTCRCCHRPFSEFDADEVLASESGAVILILAPATAAYLAAMRELGKGRALPEIVELAYGEES